MLHFNIGQKNQILWTVIPRRLWDF